MQVSISLAFYHARVFASSILQYFTFFCREACEHACGASPFDDNKKTTTLGFPVQWLHRVVS